MIETAKPGAKRAMTSEVVVCEDSELVSYLEGIGYEGKSIPKASEQEATQVIHNYVMSEQSPAKLDMMRIKAELKAFWEAA